MKFLKPTIILFTTIAFLVSCDPTKEKASPPQNTHTKKKEVLLIGTFHYHNPGADVAKTRAFDVLDEESQQQLDLIAEKISAFNPDKIFVEWPFDEQVQLDSLYHLYLEGRYFNNDSLTDFYKKNEIFQLAFRAASKNNLKGLHAIDYHETQFPFDSLMTVITINNQSELKTTIEKGIAYFTTEFDTRIENGASLLDLTYYLNSGEMRAMSNKFHTEIPLLAGEKDNFIGPFLASEWHRRNLYMWSLAQKGMEKDEHKMVLLLGASHVAMIKDYIDKSEDWKAVELQEIME